MIPLLAIAVALQPLKPVELRADFGSTAAEKLIGSTLAAGADKLDLKLLDFQKARVRDVHIYLSEDSRAEQILVCGLINSPNAAGGYTGFQRFNIRGGQWWDRPNPIPVTVTIFSPHAELGSSAFIENTDALSACQDPEITHKTDGKDYSDRLKPR